MISKTEKTKNYSYTVFPSQNVLLAKIGDGNTSAGLRFLIDSYGSNALKKSQKIKTASNVR